MSTPETSDTVLSKLPFSVVQQVLDAVAEDVFEKFGEFAPGAEQILDILRPDIDSVEGGTEGVSQRYTALSLGLLFLQSHFAVIAREMIWNEFGREPTDSEMEDRVQVLMSTVTPDYGKVSKYVAAGTLGRNKVKQSLKIELPDDIYASEAREIARSENRPYGNWVSWLIIQAVDERLSKEVGLRESISTANIGVIGEMAHKSGVKPEQMLNELLDYVIGEYTSGNLSIGDA